MIGATVVGRLGQDPEVKHLPNGTAVAEFSVAVSSTKKDVETTWVRASLFGERAQETAQKYKKGDRFASCGTLELRKWTNREGKEGATLEMRIDRVDFIHDKHEDQPSTSSNNNTRPAQPAARPGARVPF